VKVDEGWPEPGIVRVIDRHPPSPRRSFRLLPFVIILLIIISLILSLFILILVPLPIHLLVHLHILLPGVLLAQGRSGHR
jgi:hypothetical protein